jgi:hypothetical protein
MGAGFAARTIAVSHRLALKSKTLGQRPGQFDGIACVSRIVPRGLAGSNAMQDVVDVVIPLRGVIQGITQSIPIEPRCFVFFIFEYKVNGPHHR